MCLPPGLVYPAASLPEDAIQRGVKTIEINMDPSPISRSVNVFLKVGSSHPSYQGKAEEAME